MVTWSRLPVPIAMVNAWLTVPPPAESVTCNVNELVPALVGVPDRTNSSYSLSNVRPAGRLPLLMAHVYGGGSTPFWLGAPPVATTVTAKPTPTSPFAREQTPPAQGKAVVVIASGGVVAALAA